MSPTSKGKTLALLAGLLAALALVGAGSVGAAHLLTQSNRETFTDPTGDEPTAPDGKQAPDMSGGSVANDDKGNLTISLNIANRVLGPEHSDIFWAYFVSAQTTTGCIENSLVAMGYSGGGTLELDGCVNGALQRLNPPASFTASWDGRNQAVVFHINVKDLGLKVVPATSYQLNLVFWSLYYDGTNSYGDRSPDTAGHYWLYDLKFARKKIDALFPKPNFTVRGTTTWKSFVIRTTAPGAAVSVAGAGISEHGAANSQGLYTSSRLARTFKKGSHFSVTISKKGYYACSVGATVLTGPPWLVLSHSSTCGRVGIIR